ncbi:MAG: hypothetical protein LBM09_00485 [Candidatus Nomurabacteria bacterium]|jgi:hypothetical protein|nr:hypothetical protein [Candidatus Nomurabacteria bacterium]
MIMKKYKIRQSFIATIFALATIFTVATAPTSQVFAAKCGEAETYFDWGCSSSDPNADDYGIAGLLMTIFNWAAIGVTIAVIGGIIYGATLYSSAGGKADQAKKGMGIIRGAIIALILYFAMYAILNFILPQGTGKFW